MNQVCLYLGTKKPKPSQIGEYLFGKRHAHVYRDAEGNMVAMSIVKVRSRSFAWTIERDYLEDRKTPNVGVFDLRRILMAGMRR